MKKLKIIISYYDFDLVEPWLIKNIKYWHWSFQPCNSEDDKFIFYTRNIIVSFNKEQDLFLFLLTWDSKIQYKLC